jgi:DNA-binding NtrC family response regulator
VIPGLNDRREDIPLLAARIVQRIMRDDPHIALRFGGDQRDAQLFSMAFMRALVLHVHTTHVRELEALLLRSIETSKGRCLDIPTDDPGSKQKANVEDGSSPIARVATETGNDDEAGLTRAAIQAALDEHNGSIEATWRALGLSSRFVLHRLIRKYGLVVKKGPPGGRG